MYDALHEALSGELYARGYKVENHVCLGVLFKALEPDFPLERFERYRKARNRINYYGQHLSLARGKAFIAGMKAIKQAFSQAGAPPALLHSPLYRRQ